jgi:hypothetical protein
MCFSAAASFSLGGLLSVAGIVSLKKARHTSEIPFASIPLIFAAQQVTEGITWLSLNDSSAAISPGFSTYAFLFFAQVVWPFWIPFSFFQLKKKHESRLPEKILLILGTAVSLYLAYCLVTYPVSAKLIVQHIAYDQDYPANLGPYYAVLYLMATIVPPFLSNIRHMWLLGAAILISYILTAVFYTEYVVSVWCFFAAIISILILAIKRDVHVKHKLKEIPASKTGRQ